MKKNGREQILFNNVRETGGESFLATHGDIPQSLLEAANRQTESGIQENHKLKRL